MQEKTKLIIAPCSYKAAKYAVMNWHYSKIMPMGKLVKYGVWENDKYVGAVIFGRGAASHIGDSFNLKQTEICELVRVALCERRTSTSKIVSIVLKKFRKDQNIRLVVSYADVDRNHLGVIYQAGNWVYMGNMNIGGLQGYIIDGKYQHNRAIAGRMARFSGTVEELYGKDVKRVYTKGKHKYLYPLDKDMRKQIEKLRKPYPKRPAGEKVSHSAIQPEVGGAIPTAGLKFDVRGE